MPSTEPACSTLWVTSPSARTRLHTTSSKLAGIAVAANAPESWTPSSTTSWPDSSEVAHELHRVQRVAGGLDSQLLQDVAGRAARRVGDRDDQVGELGVVEPRERDAPGIAPRSRSASAARSSVDVLLGVAERGHDEHRGVDQRAGEVAEQEQRRGLGPVQVVEDEDQRAAGREPAQEVGHRFEELVALGRVVAARSVAAPRRD